MGVRSKTFVSRSGPVGGRVQPHLAEALDALLVRAAVRPAQEGLHSGHELPGPEGLHDVVVRARVQSRHRVHLRAAGGEHEDGRAGEALVAAEDAAEVQPRHAGEHPVEDHHVGHAAAEGQERHGAVRKPGDLVPLPLEGVAEGLQDVSLVLDDRDAMGHGKDLRPLMITQDLKVWQARGGFEGGTAGRGRDPVAPRARGGPIDASG